MITTLPTFQQFTESKNVNTIMNFFDDFIFYKFHKQLTWQLCELVRDEDLKIMAYQIDGNLHIVDLELEIDSPNTEQKYEVYGYLYKKYDKLIMPKTYYGKINKLVDINFVGVRFQEIIFQPKGKFVVVLTN